MPDVLLSAFLIMFLGCPVMAAVLTEIRVGRHDDFSRIVFEFQDPVAYQLIPKDRSGHATMMFFDAVSSMAHPPILENSQCVEAVTISRQENALVADITLSGGQSRRKPFVIKDPIRIVLDVYCNEKTAVVPIPSPPDTRQTAPAELPAPSDLSVEPNPMQNSATAPKVIMAPPARIPRAANENRTYQKYLVVILAALSLVILTLAGIMIYQNRTSRKKTTYDGAAIRLQKSEDMLFSIDAKIREKLRTHEEQ